MAFIYKEDVKYKYSKPINSIKDWFRYKFIEQREVYEINNPITYRLSSGDIITIEKGFETDLCSVPPFLSVIFHKNPPNILAYIIHDYLYKTDYKRDVYKFLFGKKGDKLNKQMIDREMLIIANRISPNKKIDNYLRYLAVKWFGNKVYKRTVNSY